MVTYNSATSGEKYEKTANYFDALGISWGCFEEKKAKLVKLSL